VSKMKYIVFVSFFVKRGFNKNKRKNSVIVMLGAGYTLVNI